MCNNNMNGLNNDWKIYVKDACFFFFNISHWRSLLKKY